MGGTGEGDTMSDTLTEKQGTFVTEYLIDLNGKQAAIRAGYSPATAENQASKLLSLSKVKAAVRKAQAARAKRTETSADWVIQRLARNEEAAFAKGDFAQSNRALEMIGKHHAAFVDRVSTEPAVTNVHIYKPDRTLESTKTFPAA